MEKYGKISGLTMLYESDEETLHKGLMLRYVNDDLAFDIEQKIDFELNYLKENPGTTPNYNNSYADFTYWKYKFLSSPKNKYYNLERALTHLKEAYRKGSPDAVAQYAYYYYVGEVITNAADKNKAMKLFERAFEIAKNRSRTGQETPFIESLFADALLSDCGYDVETLKKIVNYYKVAVEDKKVLNYKLKLELAQAKLGMAEQNVKNAANRTDDKSEGMFATLMSKIRESNNQNKKR